MARDRADDLARPAPHRYPLDALRVERLTAGEQWARDALERLRGQRFRPAAFGSFLADSHHRAVEVRRARPALARRARQWELAGFGAWGLLAAVGAEPFRRRLGAGLGGWAATSLMLEWHLGMVESEDGEPRNLGAADALTLSRAWLVPVVGDALRPRAIALAALTDALDGVAARATVPTRAGRDLEGLVDAALLTAALACAARERRLHPAVVGLEAGRICAGAALATGVYFGRARPPPARILQAGRWTTPLRVSGLMAAGAGLRSPADLLVATSSLAGLGLLARAIRTRPGAERAPQPDGGCC